MSEKKRIGIITFSRAYNVGAALQAYALQSFLEKEEFEVKIIDFTLRRDYEKYKPFVFSFNLKILGPKLYGLLMNMKRKKNFEVYRREFLHLTTPVFDGDNMDFLNEQFDVFIAGSDQIWNLDLTKGLVPEFFLSFAKSEKLKIAYAASIGGLTSKSKYGVQFEKMKELIQRLDAVSMRERSGVEWVKNNVREDVIEVLDPSLLLDSKDYSNVFIQENNPDSKRFLLVIFYGRKNGMIEDFCIKVAKENNLSIKHISSCKFHGIKSENLYSVSPQRFIQLISEAALVFTNSFHCTAFSIIFRKNFCSYVNDSSDSRVSNLLFSLHLQNRIFSESFSFAEKPDFKETNKLIDEKRNESIAFLLDSIEGAVR